MLVFTTRAGTACAVALLLVALSGCGDATKSVSFMLDDSRSLVVHSCPGPT